MTVRVQLGWPLFVQTVDQFNTVLYRDAATKPNEKNCKQLFTQCVFHFNFTADCLITKMHIHFMSAT